MKTSRIILPVLLGAVLAVACTKEDYGTGIRTKEDYSGAVNENGIPTYDDYYVDISGWDNHANWNLANVHDPSVAYYKGYYYMFGTSASYGNEHDRAIKGRQYQGKRSKDLVNWTHIYGPMNTAPSWVKDSLNSMRGRMGLEPIDNPVYGYWAPVIREVDGKLRMYYSVIIDNHIKTGVAAPAMDGSWGERAFIGMCETTTPEDPDSWVDHGFVVCSSSDKGLNYDNFTGSNYGSAYFYFNAIDPTYIVDGNRHWLIYGSWHSGFALLEIKPETGMPVNAYDADGKFVGLGNPWFDSVDELSKKYGVRIAARRNNYRWQGSEAPEIVKHGDYYYLFMAYDGLDVPYNTRVIRASSIEGPYFDITGNNNTLNGGDSFPIVTHPYKFADSDGWVGISHCCIFQKDGTDDWFYCSQGRLPNGVNGNNSSNALMMGHVRRIVWAPSSADNLSDLWPIALPERYAGLEKKAVKASEIPGNYEFINLRYVAGTQDESEALVLGTDNSVSGAISGTWSFDETAQFLTITPSSGTAVVVVVAHEADWEASPRVETVVFAGTQKTINTTWWGKKVK